MLLMGWTNGQWIAPNATNEVTKMPKRIWIVYAVKHDAHTSWLSNFRLKNNNFTEMVTHPPKRCCMYHFFSQSILMRNIGVASSFVACEFGYKKSPPKMPLKFATRNNPQSGKSYQNTVWFGEIFIWTREKKSKRILYFCSERNEGVAVSKGCSGWKSLQANTSEIFLRKKNM